jgi:virulence-associated protein VapD
MQFNRHAKAAMDLIGKFARTGGERLFGAIHIQRQANNDLIGLPLFQQTLNQIPAFCSAVRLR